MFKQGENSKTYYEVLKINPDSSDAEVRNSYLELAKIYHPDNNPGNKKIATLRFRLINEAYAALKKREGRNRYNRLLLANQGKPKGMHLKADNDNKEKANDNSFWNSFLEFFMPSKSVNLNKTSSRKKQAR